LKRFGRRNRACYRVNAIDSRTPRDGRVIEELGCYDPVTKDLDKQFTVNRERVEYWLSMGAQPSETVRSLLIKAGVTVKKTK
jgi:small subunit ribosomal protein S16